MMFLTQKNQIRHLSKENFETLRELCRLSKNLYNVALYNTRQQFIEDRSFLRYESNYHICKHNENYKLLNTDIAQQTMKIADRSFRSFFGLIKEKKASRYDAKVRIPSYLPKEGYFALVMPRFAREGKYLVVPMSREMKKTHAPVKIPFPERLEGKVVKEVRIHPKHGARYFEIEYVYKEEVKIADVDYSKAVAIDVGLENLATCVTTDGASYILDGRTLKSINHWYNKRKARLQSIKDKQKQKGMTNRLSQIENKRSAQVNDYMNKAVRTIIQHSLENHIGTIIIGYTKGMKNGINIGRKNNQQFVQIPHWLFRRKLKGQCEKHGLAYVEQEESYTSKASFLDQDKMPVYKAGDSNSYPFSGRRTNRGLYRSESGRCLNADVNGAGNILRKSNHEFDFEQVAKGLLASPPRIRIA